MTHPFSSGIPGRRDRAPYWPHRLAALWPHRVAIIAPRGRDPADAGQIAYTYGELATAALIDAKLADLVLGADALAPSGVWRRMVAQLRNAGR